MIELKQDINELCRRLGEPPRYDGTDAVAAGILPAVSGGILPLGSKPDERL
jgi:hypothetical protein